MTAKRRPLSMFGLHILMTSTLARSKILCATGASASLSSPVRVLGWTDMDTKVPAPRFLLSVPGLTQRTEFTT